jgi:hypothetical protein
MTLALMEKIMSKTNEASNIAERHDTLADSELDAVAGGVKAKEMDTPAALIAAAFVKSLMP